MTSTTVEHTTRLSSLAAPVTVVTGAGSGIGRATARRMTGQVVLVGRTVEKLRATAHDITEAGEVAVPVACDVSDAHGLRQVAELAADLGPVRAVIHAAGQSPHMGSATDLLTANALGTLAVHDAFVDVMEPGGALVDVSSLAAHLVPSLVLPRRLYPLAATSPEAFLRRVSRRLAVLPEAHRSGLAYAISKDYVRWLVRTDAGRFGARGLRVLSVSPGYVDTPMAELESDEADFYLANAALPRLGRPDELAGLLAYCVSDAASYLTGTDILCDGGVVASGASGLAAVRQPRVRVPSPSIG